MEASYIKCFHNESNGVISNAITVFKPSKLAGRGHDGLDKLLQKSPFTDGTFQTTVLH